MNHHLELSLPLMNQLPLSDAENIDTVDKTMERVIQEAIHDYVPLISVRGRRNEWWTEELSRLKRELKRAKRNKNPVLTELRKNYEATIIRAKEAAWQKFIEGTKDTDDAFVRFRILCGKHGIPQINPVMKSDGSITTTASETFDELLRYTFPDSPSR